MELHDLYVRIGPRFRGGGCPILSLWLSTDRQPLEIESVAAIPRQSVDALDAGLASLTDLTTLLEHQVVVERGPGQSPLTNLLLDIQAPDLYPIDWERVLRRPTLPADVVRFRDLSDDRLLLPFGLPMRSLHVLQLNAPLPVPSDYVTRYYRAHRVTGIDDTDVSGTICADRYDIVHLVITARWRADARGELSVEYGMGTTGEGVSADPLRRALVSCGARFLILQCDSPLAYAPALDVAHRLLRAGGPTTVVVESATPPYLDALYMDIVHDTPLDVAVSRARVMAPRTALFESIGGAGVLQISRLAQGLVLSASRSASAMADLPKPPPTVRNPGTFGFRRAESPSVHGVGYDEAFQRALANRVYNYSRESGAWIPLGRDLRAYARQATALETMQRAMGRVVNVGLLDGGAPLASDRTLRPDERYELSVQIGRRAEWSLVDGNAAFPEAAVERHYIDDGVELRVVVFGGAFEVLEPERRLRLPRPPEESPELHIAVRAPKREGRYRIRVCLYHENNLVQSVLMSVGVHARREATTRHPRPVAEVEFALSATLTDLQRLPKRGFNFLTNATDEGTHTIAVVGNALRNSFDFGETEMRAAVDAVRESLYAVAADASTTPPTYRFDANNRTTLARLETDAVRLAELGYLLYSNLVTGKDRAFDKQLSDALGPSGATIQVSATKSAQYVFPWALVYDHPLVVGALKICPQFAADVRASTPSRPLVKQVCLTQGCPNKGNTYIVCPSGFWGFKHFIEQPLSVSTEPNASGKRDLVLELKAGPAGTAIPALMAVSRELKQVGDHEVELRNPSSFAFAVKDSKAAVGLGMQDAAHAAINLVYFYCHGGRDKSRTWLGIGKKERLVASDLNAWGIDWTDIHPLVFINGCHTADVTPDDLLSFNKAFAWCRAAGVIGTEINIPEGLARAFARGFLTRFGGGASVGEALRQERLAFLEGNNLLGLVYTPYCSADLRVVHQ